MSGTPIQPSAEVSNRDFWNRLFLLWAATGLLWSALSVVSAYKCPSLAPAERAFRFVNDTPEKRVQYEDFDKWVARLTWLANGALVYGLLGVSVFFRRGCIVFVIAGGVIVICQFTLLDAVWVAP